jgi:hypothetical protein
MARTLTDEEVAALGLEDAPKPKPVRALSPEEVEALGLERPTFTGKAEVVAEQAKQLEDAGYFGRFAVGFGHGMLNTAQNLGDIAGRLPGLGALRPDREAWRAQEEAAAPLLESRGGGAGNLTGEIAATLPLGAGVGGGVRALGAAGARMLPRLAAAAVPLAALGAEGATQGYVLAGPENRGVGALAGGGAGLLLGGLGRALGAGARRLAAPLARAQARAVELGQAGAEKLTRALRSEAGQKAQALYRTLEHINALRSKMTPEAAAELAELEASGVIREVEQELASKSVQKLAPDLAAHRTAQAAFGEGLESQAQQAAQLGEAAATSSAGADVRSLLKMYAEPLAWSVVGGKIGDALGLDPVLTGGVAGLVGGRTRAGKAIANRLAKPGNQMALINALRSAATKGARLLGSDVTTGAATPMLPIPRAGPMSLLPELADADELEMQQQLAALRRGR